MHNPPHPGLVLREYLGDLAVTKAAAHLRITRATVSRVLNGKAGISAAMVILLAAALGTTPELWITIRSRDGGTANGGAGVKDKTKSLGVVEESGHYATDERDCESDHNCPEDEFSDGLLSPKAFEVIAPAKVVRREEPRDAKCENNEY